MDRLMHQTQRSAWPSLHNWLLALAILSSNTLVAQGGDALTPAESLTKLRLADPNLIVELMAAEPQIDSPVALTWDASGALYVVQMSDYPTAETGGSIRRLIDADRDGTYEQVTTFAAGLRWPSGALAWNNGLLVTAAPDILYLQDRDGDGVAEHRETLYTGFVEGNQQLRVNGLIWGLDNRVYGANGRSGGMVRSLRAPDQPAVSIQRHDFRFNPTSGQFEALAGFSQFGLGRDDFNHRFLSWNTLPFRQAVIEQADLNRNPRLTNGESIALIAESQDTGRVFPISAPPKTFNRERTDYFNASCGSMIFRGHGLGPEYQGNAFVGEPLTNLVHRKTLEQQGPVFSAKRVEQNQEFLASTDNWTHPVYLALGPDGCLYFADFYREWVEHPQFVQEALRKGVDFRVGHQHGRIWRVRRKDFSAVQPPSLQAMTNTQLVETLESENAWVRETAQRLLVERQSTDVTNRLGQVVRNAPRPLARAQGLWVLQGIGQLTNDLLQVALQDSSAAVRCQAIGMSRWFGRGDQDLAKRVLELQGDTDQEVRFQVALFAGDVASEASRRTLATIALRDADQEWMRLAILSGLGAQPEEFLGALQQAAPHVFQNPTPGMRLLMCETIRLVASGGDLNEPGLVSLVETIVEVGRQDESVGIMLLAGLGEGLRHTKSPLHQALQHPPVSWNASITVLQSLVDAASRIVRNRDAAIETRRLAWEVWLRASPSDSGLLIPELLNPEQPQELQTAAARGVGEIADPELAKSLLENWGTYTLNARRELLTALARQPELVRVLLDGLEAKQIEIREIDFPTRDALARRPEPELKERVQKLLSNQTNSNRQQIIDKYSRAAEASGNNQRGAALFTQHCAGCHQMRGEGARVGPELSGIASRPKPAILVDILDPSREVSPDFVNFFVVTRQGQVFLGLLVAETPGGVRLKRQQGAEDFIPRSEIEELRVNSKSIMPDGFEERFNEQNLADLLEFLHHPVPLPKNLPN